MVLRSRWLSPFFPRGVPTGLITVGHRIASALAHTPLFFIAIVVGIAVLFRLGIAVVRTGSADATTEPEPPHAMHEAKSTR